MYSMYVCISIYFSLHTPLHMYALELTESFQFDEVDPMQSSAIGKSDEDDPMRIWRSHSQIRLDQEELPMFS